MLVGDDRFVIILIGGEKGGTGKTTIATNLAAMRARSGADVLLVDTDKQSSSSYWASSRDEDGISPRIPSIQKFGKSIKADIRDLANRYEDIIIDAGGRDSLELRVSMLVAEKLYIPLQASQFDVWTLARMNDLVEEAEAYNDHLKACVVFNRASTHPSVSELKDATEAIGDFSHLGLADSVIRDRIAYRKAAQAGKSVVELDPADPKACSEIGQLYAEVFNG